MVAGKEASKREALGCFLYRQQISLLAGAAVATPQWRRVTHHDAEVGAVSNSEPRFAREFYRSWPWIKCQRAYRDSKGRLCERCLKKGLIVPGDEVHHKIRLTPENISDPEVALNFDNLELLCKDCHLEEHRGTRWRADELGHVEL